MLKKIKISLIVIAIVFGSVLSAQLLTGTTFAATVATECDGKTGDDYSRCAVCHPEISSGAALTPAQLTSCQKCVSASLNSNPMKTADQAANDQNATVACLNNNIIVRDINTIVTVLTGLVGIVIVGSIILGGIQYSFSSGKQDSTANAKKRIIHSFVALVAFLLIWGFLQWLVPGGVF